MDTVDRPFANLPAQFPAPVSPLPALIPPHHGELISPSGLQISSRVLLRGLGRHWWKILLLWLVASVPLAWSIFVLIEPTYEAYSTIRIEARAPEIYGGKGSDTLVDWRIVSTYLQTQVNVLTSDRVLEEAIASPAIVHLAAIRQSDDAKADLRKKLSVDIMENSNFIRVALELPSASEAAAIVNAVVDTYIAQNLAHNRTENRKLVANLDLRLKGLRQQEEEKKKKLEEMAKEGKITIAKADLNFDALKKDSDQLSSPTLKTLTAEQYQRAMAEFDRIDGELTDAKVRLEVLENHAADHANQVELAAEDLQTRITEEFNNDPEVSALGADIEKAKTELERIKKGARQHNDPSLRAVRDHLEKLNTQWEALWKKKYNDILARVQAEDDEADPAEGPDAIRKLKMLIESLTLRQKLCAKKLESEISKNNDSNGENFKATLLNYELTRLLTKVEQVSTFIEQLNFEAEREDFRVEVQDRAYVPKMASNNKRLKYMAAAPVAILFMMVGLFLMLEIKAERVADPDSLSTRVRSEVFALPPLPTARSMRKLSAPQQDDQIEQFIQRLDHVRFAVCGGTAQLGKGRCVLITSAIGGEGKTTLAAQLAARCGNAGMSTLLIDADLRRAALGTLLEVPEGPGLSDVLQDESSVDEVVIPVQGGTFYLFPAGTPIQDTSRVLQSRKFEALITQLRQLYDLIIIDSPPILPVPDALILGRWVDGAVLAARYDISRFPQVQRARRALDSAGIAILGTVINGMRHSDSYYGRYTYSRRRPSQSEPVQRDLEST